MVTKFPNHWWASSCPTTSATHCLEDEHEFLGSMSSAVSLEGGRTDGQTEFSTDIFSAKRLDAQRVVSGRENRKKTFWDFILNVVLAECESREKLDLALDLVLDLTCTSPGPSSPWHLDKRGRRRRHEMILSLSSTGKKNPLNPQ